MAQVENLGYAIVGRTLATKWALAADDINSDPGGDDLPFASVGAAQKYIDDMGGLVPDSEVYIVALVPVVEVEHTPDAALTDLDESNTDGAEDEDG